MRGGDREGVRGADEPQQELGLLLAASCGQSLQVLSREDTQLESPFRRLPGSVRKIDKMEWAQGGRQEAAGMLQVDDRGLGQGGGTGEVGSHSQILYQTYTIYLMCVS